MTKNKQPTEQPFKPYEQMSPEERRARAEEVFVWKKGDLIFLDPETGEWLDDEAFSRRRHGADENDEPSTGDTTRGGDR
jgi:hypothetical protein